MGPNSRTDRDWHQELGRAVSLLPAMDGYAHLFHEDREDLRAVVSANGLEEVVQTRHAGLSARVGPWPGRYVYIADPALTEAEEVARRAVTQRWDSPRRRASNEPLPTRIDARRAVGRLLRIVEAAEGLCEGAERRILASWVEFEQTVCVSRTDRVTRSDRRGGQRVRVELSLEKNGKRSHAVAEEVLHSGREDRLDTLGSIVARRAFERLDARPAPRGDHPVVFGPGVGGVLVHELVGHALEADTVRRGGSFLARQTGTITPSEVTVIDDPGRGRAAWSIDDEGEAAIAAELLRGGRVQGYLYDQGMAVLFGARCTGHGRRAAFRESVRPRMGCTFLDAGPLEPAETVSSVQSGVYVRRMEAATIDTQSGAALFRVTDADRILEGRIDAPLKPFCMAVHTSTALSTLTHVANDLAFDTSVGSCLRDGQALSMSVGAPTFRIGMGRVISH